MLDNSITGNRYIMKWIGKKHCKMKWVYHH